MGIYWPPLIGGVVAMAIGILVFNHRERLADHVDRRRRAVFGEKLTRLMTPGEPERHVAVAGLGFVVIGLVCVALAVVVPEDRW